MSEEKNIEVELNDKKVEQVVGGIEQVVGGTDLREHPMYNTLKKVYEEKGLDAMMSLGCQYLSYDACREMANIIQEDVEAEINTYF